MKAFVYNVMGKNKEGESVWGDVVLAEDQESAWTVARKIAQQGNGQIEDVKLVGVVTGVSPALHLGEVLQLQDGELQPEYLRQVVTHVASLPPGPPSLGQKARDLVRKLRNR